MYGSVFCHMFILGGGAKALDILLFNASLTFAQCYEESADQPLWFESLLIVF